ncbi:Gfo/Idh/MocA family protein [Bremerella sp. T1]|uniref:Gfo/Idh/MocA family protein n=1 Tax=Bremerella sp. TYQ1 TaxID=3119568 RepID=UPI001CCC68E4|nr:Gfo/Idh/MocA family oxidoreductase [Bremerella volcania]UBM38938.1 Gfo/Idh/MocA family oxidoreductase [Bremerella volcania]
MTLTALGWKSLVRGDSPLEQLRVGVIGTGVRGKYLIGNLPSSVRVTAICDCAYSRMDETLHPQNEFIEVLDVFKELYASRCHQYQDYRLMLDREPLDAVIIATPDHHHSHAAILALDAGLDVYLEKPMTVSIGEGRLIVEKVTATGQILQVGSQQRSMEMNKFACDFIRNGGLGKITAVDLPNYPGPITNPEFPEEPIPKGFDWGLFLGPSPMRAHNKHLWVKDTFKVDNLVWRGWDLFQEFSGHLMTNWGAHSVDMVLSAIGCDETGPVSIRTIRPDSVKEIWKSWGHKTPPPSTPDDRRFWPVEMSFANGITLRFCGGNKSIRFQGELGTLEMGRNMFSVNPAELVLDGPDPGLAAKWRGAGNVARPHLEDWLECIHSRNTPIAPAEFGHRTATVCHLANLARELNRPLDWNPDIECFVDDKEANSKLERPRRAGFDLSV